MFYALALIEIITDLVKYFKADYDPISYTALIEILKLFKNFIDFYNAQIENFPKQDRNKFFHSENFFTQFTGSNVFSNTHFSDNSLLQIFKILSLNNSSLQ